MVQLKKAHVRVGLSSADCDSEVVSEHQMGRDYSCDCERAGGDTVDWACHWLNDRRSGLKYRSACDPCRVAEWVVPRRASRFDHCGLGGLCYAAPSCSMGSVAFPWAYFLVLIAATALLIVIVAQR